MREDHSGARLMFGPMKESANWRIERVVVKTFDSSRHAGKPVN